MFDYELDFMIYFGFFFIKLSRPHGMRIMLNKLTQVNLTHFSIKFFTNFIVQLSLIGSFAN